MNTYGRQKVLFGTDWPVIDPERAMRDVKDLGLRPESERALLRDNALRVFKLPGYKALLAKEARAKAGRGKGK
jgi:predicted TIM-barrel fold metal-dependent hydrolase